MVGLHIATPIYGAADRSQADAFRALRLWTGDNGTGGNHALVREQFQVTGKSAVAEVAVLKFSAVVIALAIAIDGIACTLSRLALVSDCTGVTIITLLDVGQILAAAFDGAMIVGARVLVVTVEGSGAQARPLAAMVPGGAGVAIIALRGISCMEATGVGVALVVGADIAVVAVVHPLSFATRVVAVVTDGARIAIVANCFVGCEYAALFGVTAIIGANVAIIAK